MNISSQMQARFLSVVSGNSKGKCMRTILNQYGLPQVVAIELIKAIQNQIVGMKMQERINTLASRQSQALFILGALDSHNNVHSVTADMFTIALEYG
ncbi:hypothetical protein [Photobacterium nomapromontoriensis]|uniref:hypothetical protein n=1 Tax=Photobacterium nomapromontoriensis TaxID=2910237 RepID=UPI003D14C142